jgi:hypothetical protein
MLACLPMLALGRALAAEAGYWILDAGSSGYY